MTSGTFTISHTAVLQEHTAALMPRPDELCPQQLDSSLLDNLPAIVFNNITSASEINMLSRVQLIKLLHAWLYVQSQQQNTSLDNAAQIRRNIETIMLKRVTPTLLQHIWSCYQYYPHLSGFTDFLLRLAQNTSPAGKRFFLPFLKNLTADNSPEQRKPLDALLKLSVSPDADSIRENFCRTEQLAIKYPLASVYASKMFPGSKLTVNSSELQTRPLCSLLTALDIIPDTPFLIEFLTKYFTEGTDDRLLANKNIWLYTLRNSDRSDQLAVMHSFLSSFRLEEKWLDFNRAIEAVLANIDLMEQLNYKARKHFQQWQLIDRINQHSGGQIRKKLFYRDFYLNLRELIDWSDNVKIIKLTDFVLADNKEEPELLWFIDNTTYELLTEGKHTDILYFENNREIPTARDISLNHSGENIVKLKLDEVNILYARDFIKQKLKKDNKKI